MRFRQLFITSVAVLLLTAACSGMTPRHVPDDDGRQGMSRVSPVRNADLNTRLGVGYFERGDLRTAIEKLNRAIQLDPAHVPAYITLALVQEELGRNQLARQHYRDAARLAPNDGATLNAYGTFLCRQGEYAESDKLFRRAVADPFYETREMALANAGSCARQAGDVAGAERYLRQALDINPEYSAALFQMTRLFLLNDEPFRARAFLQRYEASAGHDAGSLLLGFRIEDALGNRREADRYFTRLEESYPDSPEAKTARQHTNSSP